ncbi:MAG: Prepilin-type N-terminal cleavage/methylation protein [Cyanobacteriota bacterium erpe_2018_sw_21hr_WHONDRS-SW48-000092_B_bin.40]|nr:Prepilin-type N-terminal cleavage/methylation protein [Cyanobacteriota bacterium erpe_2018_sw_21hr_WHONDRS-SW48-000092_B_bin.40]
MADKAKARRRGSKGSSLIELMLSSVIIGIVIAGTSQAIFINTAWYSALQNRLDNGMSARMFLRRIGNDIRMSYQVEPQSNTTKLVLSKMPNSQFDPQGFFNTPLLMTGSQITYWVETDDTYPGTYRIMYQNTFTGETNLVMRGILGPLSKTTGQPIIFQYISRLYPCAQTDLPDQLTGSVVLNLELRRTDYGSDTGAIHAVSNSVNRKSAIALRTEYMLRNTGLHGTN